jgi:hypothetical protein
MTASITDRLTRPQPERPVQQVKAAEDNRAAAAATAAKNQQARSAQEDKAASARQADKGRHVDRYA